MEISARKLTDLALLQRACAVTMGRENSRAQLEALYDCEHSPIRTQLFWIEMLSIPSFVSVHLVRHKVGVEHFVRSLRDDRGGRGDEGRDTPVNHVMLINAQALIQMARKRLCGAAHIRTRRIMAALRDAVAAADPVLARFMVPECDYRGGWCHELKSCGRRPRPASPTPPLSLNPKENSNS
jgi:hypothetical protein